MSVPKLRFKEFSSEWEEKTLQELADVKGGKRIPKGYSLQDESNGLPYITVTDMYKGGVDSKHVRYIPTEIAESIKNYKITTNDIFISVAGTLGIVGIVPKELNNANLTENANKLTNLKCHKHYLLQYLLSDRLVNLIDNVQTVGAQPKLAIYALNSFEVSTPSLPEQTKIANFLTTVDEKISLLTQKADLLSQYKKGVMQQIFSQELRFKDDDGQVFPEWEEKTLGEISDVTKLAGYEFTKHIVYRDTGDIIALRGLNVKENKLDLTSVKYIDESDFSKLSRSKLIINDLLFTYVGTIGDVALIKENDKFYLAPNVSRIRVNSNILMPSFALHYFNNSDFKEKQINLYIATSSQPALSMENIRKFKIELPALKEQTKIANFLTSIDEKITNNQTQLNAVKQYKQGLLQQMFV